MMTRVSDLAGAELALWVARAIGLHITCDTWQGAGVTYVLAATAEGEPMFEFEPQIDWSQAGPLIERETIEIHPSNAKPHCSSWWAKHPHNGWQTRGYGPTPLIAAMRALVASVFGEEVEG